MQPLLLLVLSEGQICRPVEVQELCSWLVPVGVVEVFGLVGLAFFLFVAVEFLGAGPELGDFGVEVHFDSADGAVSLLGED
jgi:hypothetical protein